MSTVTLSSLSLLRAGVAPPPRLLGGVRAFPRSAAAVAGHRRSRHGLLRPPHGLPGIEIVAFQVNVPTNDGLPGKFLKN